LCVVCPALEIVIVPPQVHISVEESFSAGAVLIITVDAPGAHGAGVKGTQGMGVSTPIAAAVAAATCGFDGLWHIPKGMMFFIGMLSKMFAAGTGLEFTSFSGVTTSELGDMPMEHFNIAPLQTWSAICLPPPWAQV
jgi:hypothetical protein